MRDDQGAATSSRRWLMKIEAVLVPVSNPGTITSLGARAGPVLILAVRHPFLRPESWSVVEMPCRSVLGARVALGGYNFLLIKQYGARIAVGGRAVSAAAARSKRWWE